MGLRATGSEKDIITENGQGGQQNPSALTQDFRQQRAFSNPFRTQEITYPTPDYQEGFIIQQFGGRDTETEPLLELALAGSFMPLSPFDFSGGQRIQKDYYPGDEEPVIQVLGPVEHEVTIRGRLWVRNFPRELAQGELATKLPTAVRNRIEEMRYSGGLCRIKLGTWVRYAYIEETRFSLTKENIQEYTITFSIVGLRPPQIAKFADRDRTFPTEQNQALVALGEQFNTQLRTAQFSLTIADGINQIVSEVATQINVVTGYIDSIADQVIDTKRAINRAIGLVERTKNTVQEFRNIIQNFDPETFGEPANAQLKDMQEISRAITSSSNLMAILSAIRVSMEQLLDQIPQAQHLVRFGDTPHSLSVQYFDTVDRWRDIVEFNDLEPGSPLALGTLIEIPGR